MVRNDVHVQRVVLIEMLGISLGNALFKTVNPYSAEFLKIY